MAVTKKPAAKKPAAKKAVAKKPVAKKAPAKKKVVAKKNQLRSIKPAFRNFDDWLFLGAIIISVGLFMRYKDKVV